MNDVDRTYKPLPIDTSEIHLPASIRRLMERLAEHNHDVWAAQRIAEGWRWGRSRDDAAKTHPGLVPYARLPETEKDYDRNTASQILKAILKLGYRIQPPDDGVAASPQETIADVAALLARIDDPQSALTSLIAIWQSRLDTPSLWLSEPMIYQRLAERLLKLGAPVAAYDVATEGLERLGDDVRLRQLQALALARTGAVEKANALLLKLREENHLDEETLGMLGRTFKDLAHSAVDEPSRADRLRQAVEIYEQAYELSGGYWSGINVATLSLMLGRRERAVESAARVRDQCLARLASIDDASAETYWLAATLGEASLVLGDFSAARDYYARAAQLGRNRFGDLASTRRQARMLADQIGRDAQWLEECLPMPRVIVFAGHRFDRSDRPAARFPRELESAVRDAIETKLEDLGAGIGYSSAAAGADLLFAECMLARGGEISIVLPYERDEFARNNVRVFQDADYTARFGRVLEAAADVHVISGQKMQRGSLSYDYANLVLYGLAGQRAGELQTELSPLIVWDGRVGVIGRVMEQWSKLGDEPHVIDLAAIRRAHSGPATQISSAAVMAVEAGGATAVGEFPGRIMAMLFADAARFSELTEQQVPVFVRQYMGPIRRLIDKTAHGPVYANTWGDGLYFVFETVRDAGLFALDLCDTINEIDFASVGLPEHLSMRVALHAGPVYCCVDPVTGQQTYTGTHVSRAARIEPRTPPGHVYASQGFAALAAAERIDAFKCDYVGRQPLAKGYGTFPLYHVRRRGR